MKNITPIKFSEALLQQKQNDIIQNANSKKLSINIDKVNIVSKELDLHCNNLEEASNKIHSLKNKLLKEKIFVYYRQGLILSQVRENGWFKEKYKNLTEYVKAEFGFTGSYAYNLIKIVNTFELSEIKEIGDRFSVIETIALLRTISVEQKKQYLERAKRQLGKGKTAKEVNERAKRRAKKDRGEIVEPKEKKTTVIEEKEGSKYKELITGEQKRISIIDPEDRPVKTVDDLIVAEISGFIIKLDEEVGIQILLSAGESKLKVFYEFVMIESTGSATQV